MKTGISLSFFCFYTSIILAVTPTPSPKLKRHHSDEPDTITSHEVTPHDTTPKESAEKEPSDPEITSSEENENNLAQAVAWALESLPHRSSSEESISEEKQSTISTLNYTKEIDIVAQRVFEKYHTVAVTDYPKTASWLFISLNQADEKVFTIAGHKELYIYSADTGECQNKNNPITFEKPILKTDFVQNNILQVVLGEKQCTYIDIQSKKQTTHTLQTINNNRFSRIINLDRFPELKTNVQYNPTISGKRLIIGKKKCIAITDDPFVRIYLHNKKAFSKEKESLARLVSEQEPSILKIFNQWKQNQPCPSEYFEDETNLNEELLTTLQEMNVLYTRYQAKKFPQQESDIINLEDDLSSEESNSSSSSSLSSNQLSSPPSYDDSFYYY